MNRMILTTLVLPSVLGLTHVAAAVEPKPITSSVVLLAEAAQPAGLADVALAAGGNAALAAATSPIHAAVLPAAVRTAGTSEYAFKGDTPLESSAPRVTRAVEVNLTPQELSLAPAVSSVTLHAVVDEHGVPRNVSVTKSAGAAVDQKAIAAVSQYRFAPAMIDNQPTWSSVSVTIKIQK